MINWHVEIVQLYNLKQRLDAADNEKLYTLTLPSVAASEQALSVVEARLGFCLDGEYKSFLQHADGWQHFFHKVHLFGTRELSGYGLYTRANKLLQSLHDPVLSAPKSSLMPIAVSENDIDLFVLDRSSETQSQPVIWFAGGEIERFSSFNDFWVGMRELIEDEIIELTS